LPHALGKAAERVLRFEKNNAWCWRSPFLLARQKQGGARSAHADSFSKREEKYVFRLPSPARAAKRISPMVDSAEAFRRLESHDRWRRHCLDANSDGRLWAVNPENGYFGVVAGRANKSNPNAMKSIGATRFTPTSR